VLFSRWRSTYTAVLVTKRVLFPFTQGSWSDRQHPSTRALAGDIALTTYGAVKAAVSALTTYTLPASQVPAPVLDFYYRHVVAPKLNSQEQVAKLESLLPRTIQSLPTCGATAFRAGHARPRHCGSARWNKMTGRPNPAPSTRRSSLLVGDDRRRRAAHGDSSSGLLKSD
jgi:hypothetical protein